MGLCDLVEESYYHDEPKFYQFKARIKHSKEIGIGTSFDKEDAIKRALGEAVERYCISKTELLKKNTRKCWKNDFGFDFANLPFLYHQDEFLRKVNNEKYNWVRGYELVSIRDKKNNTECLIPAHLVYAPYQYKKFYENIYIQPISTGAAMHSSLSEAILSGILEVIERDAFIISFYTHNCNGIYNVNHIRKMSDNLANIISELDRCNFGYYFIDISTIPGIYVILSLLFDKSQNALVKFVSGLGVSFNLEKAIEKSVEESLQIRPWLRDVFSSGFSSKVINKDSIKTFKQRALYWNQMSVNQIKKRLNFYIKSPSIPLYKKNIDSNSEKKLQYTFNQLKAMGNKIYYVDLTTEEIRKRGFVVVKVLCTKMQPLFLDENFKCLRGERIECYKVFNQQPHFFL